jgi:hypothetical protein
LRYGVQPGLAQLITDAPPDKSVCVSQGVCRVVCKQLDYLPVGRNVPHIGIRAPKPFISRVDASAVKSGYRFVGPRYGEGVKR